MIELTVEDKEKIVLELFMELVQAAKTNRKADYREVRKSIIRLHHGNDPVYKNIIKVALSSFKSINIGD